MEIITNPVNSKETLNILKGINILLGYDSEGDLYAFDKIIVFMPISLDQIEVSEEDRIKLKELGWFIEKERTDGDWATYV